ncbi:MAG: hypothetical protein HBSAPP03_27590 [Phycisphaerae bacterium]|nr:MAG: hypothetical protein HBSAPP03_27590 [Phycisphaerae bacterium]
MTASRSSAQPHRAGDRPRLASRFRAIVLVVALLAIMAFAVAEGDAAQALVFAVGATAGWLVTETGPRRGVPKWATALVLIGVLIGAVMRTIQGTPMVSAFATFLASILVLKLWERRETKDYGQLLTFSVFLVIGAALTSTTVWLGVVLAGMIPTLTAAVMMYQIVRTTEPAGVVDTPSSWRSQRRGLAAMIALAVTGGIVAGSVIFVLVPRNEGLGALWLRMQGPAIGRQTGFTDRVDLESGGLVSTSPAVVMEVSVRLESTQAPLGSSLHRQYLRGLVLDSYDRGVWNAGLPPESWRRETRSRGQVLRVSPLDRARPVVVQVITPRTPSREFTPIFALSRLVTVDFLRTGSEVEYRHNGVHDEVVHREEGTTPVRYRARSQVDEEEVTGDWPRAPFNTDAWHGLAATARDVLRNAGVEPDPAHRPPREDARAARAFETFVRTRCAYDLSAPAPPLGQEPTEWFLFTSRRGRCEHFASALAGLCRSVGIEAHVVAGYLASEFDEERGVYVVRQSDAHAWVEVRTGPDQWRPFDATPASDLARLAEARRGFIGTLARWFDSFETTWNSRVAMFDATAQRRLLGLRPGTPSWTDEAGDRLRAIYADLQPEADADRPSRWRWAWAVGIPILLMTGWVVARRRLVRARAFRNVPQPGANVLRDLEHMLRPSLGARPAWIPIRSWAGRSGPEAQAIADMVYRWVFGGDRPDSTELKRVRERLTHLRRGLREQRDGS